MILTEQSKL